MKKLSLVLLVLFFSCQTENKAEIVKMNRITLSYKHSMSQQSLIVHVERYQSDHIQVSYRHIPIGATNPTNIKFTSYTIDSDQFDKITTSISKIDRENIEKEAENIGLDGSSTSISFYKKDKNTVMNTYNLWTPYYNTKERKLEDYMYAYKELVKLARMDTDSLF